MQTEATKWWAASIDDWRTCVSQCQNCKENGKESDSGRMSSSSPLLKHHYPKKRKERVNENWGHSQMFACKTISVSVMGCFQRRVASSEQYKQGFRFCGPRILKSGGHLRYLEMLSKALGYAVGANSRLCMSWMNNQIHLPQKTTSQRDFKR